MPRRATKPDPPSAAYEDALTAHTVAEQAFDELDAEIRGREMAISLTREKEHEARRIQDHGSVALKELRQRAARYVIAAKTRPFQFEQETDELRRCRAQANELLLAANENLATQKARRASEIAVTFQPRQKAIASRIGGALTALSQAIADAEELAGEFERASPAPSPFFPNITSGLAAVRLSDWNSDASKWAKRMRDIGVIG